MYHMATFILILFMIPFQIIIRIICLFVVIRIIWSPLLCNHSVLLYMTFCDLIDTFLCWQTLHGLQLLHRMLRAQRLDRPWLCLESFQVTPHPLSDGSPWVRLFPVEKIDMLRMLQTPQPPWSLQWRRVMLQDASCDCPMSLVPMQPP